MKRQFQAETVPQDLTSISYHDMGVSLNCKVLAMFQVIRFEHFLLLLLIYDCEDVTFSLEYLTWQQDKNKIQTVTTCDSFI